jgi:hypothetical protein
MFADSLLGPHFPSRAQRGWTTGGGSDRCGAAVAIPAVHSEWRACGGGDTSYGELLAVGRIGGESPVPFA